jgi:actin
MMKEMRTFAPSSIKMKVVAPPQFDWRIDIVFPVHISRISKEEFDESGPSIVHRKCFQTDNIATAF